MNVYFLNGTHSKELTGISPRDAIDLVTLCQTIPVNITAGDRDTDDVFEAAVFDGENLWIHFEYQEGE